MKISEDFLKNKILLVLVILLIGSSSAYPFFLKNKQVELKREKRHKLAINKYKYFYLKNGMFYKPPASNRGAIDLLE